jgi:hypothetical protein
VIHGDDQHTLACLARRLRQHFTTRGLFSDNPGFACPDPEPWTKGIEPTAEDLTYFEDKAEQ